MKAATEPKNLNPFQWAVLENVHKIKKAGQGLIGLGPGTKSHVVSEWVVVKGQNYKVTVIIERVIEQWPQPASGRPIRESPPA